MKTHSKVSAALIILSLVVILAISVSAAAPSSVAAKPPNDGRYPARSDATNFVTRRPTV